MADESQHAGGLSVWDQWGNVDVPQTPSSRLDLDNLQIAEHGETDSDRKADKEVLDEYEELLKQRTHHHFGYPYNLNYVHDEIFRFLKYSINNLGDPFVTSNYGVHSRQFELAVLDFFAKLWKIERGKYWGYVTTCGTEGNLHGILVAREMFPDGILYTSAESHYSLMKAARFYRMQAISVPTLYTGEIDYDHLKQDLQRNRDKPAIINVNIGTTVKGAVDNLDRILRILSQLDIPRDRFYIHCDGALFALMLPFVKFGPEVSFQKPIDSIAVSGHKFLGCPMPCGVCLTRKSHMKAVESRIEYLNSVDTTIVGSRNGQAPLFLWYTLRRRGVDGLRQDTDHCFAMAHYLFARLRALGISTMLNDLSSTVVLERPDDTSFIRKWQLACEGDIAHVVVMPNVTKDKIDVFLDELVASRGQPESPKCVHRHIGRFCVCNECVDAGRSLAHRLEDGVLSSVASAQESLKSPEDAGESSAEEGQAADVCAKGASSSDAPADAVGAEDGLTAEPLPQATTVAATTH